MANDVRIDIVANSTKFEAAIEKAIKKVQDFGNKNRELSSVLDTEYRNVARAANNLSGTIGSSFNSLNIKSDFGLGELKKTLENDKLYFRAQFKAIVEDANTTFADVARARRSLAGIESTFNAQSLKDEFKTLGIESAASIEAAKIKIQNAYAEIAASGTKSSQDILRAQEAMVAEITRLDAKLVTSATRAASERAAAMKEAQASYAAAAMGESGSAANLIGQNLAGSDFAVRLKAQLEEAASVTALMQREMTSYATQALQGEAAAAKLVGQLQAGSSFASQLKSQMEGVAKASQEAAEQAAVMAKEKASYAAQAMSESGSAAKLVGQQLAGAGFSSKLQAEMQETAKINMLHEEALAEDIRRNKKRLADEEATLRKITLLHKEAAKINADFNKGLVDGEGVYKNSERAAGGINLLSMASIAAIAKVQVMYSLINTAMSALASFPSTVMSAVEDYQSAIISNAAMITSMQTGLNDVGKAYQENKKYAEAVEQVLIKMDTQTSASAQNLRDMNTQFMQQGVLIAANNIKQYEGFKNIANALTVMNANAPNKEQQYSQEIRSLQDFSTRPGNKLVQYLQSQGVTKEMVEGWKQVGQEIGNSGYLLEKLDGYFKGFAEASKDIDGLWITIKSSLSTVYNEILRGAMTGAVEEITANFKDMLTYIQEHKEVIESGIYKTWLSIKGVIESTSILISSLNPVLNETDSIIGMIFKGWSLISSVALPVIAEEIKGLITSLNAMMNILYESVLAGANLGGVIATGVVNAAKAASQMLTLDFDGAGKTAGNMFSGKFLDSFREHVAGVKGAGITIKEEFTRDSSFDKRYADWNKSFAKKETTNTVKTPTGLASKIDEEAAKKAREAADALQKAKLAQDEAYTKLERERIRQTADFDKEINEENYKNGLVDLKQYLDTKHAYTLKAVQDQIKDQRKLLTSYEDEATKYSTRGEDKDDLKFAEVMKKVNDETAKLVQLEGQKAVLEKKNADESMTRIKKTLEGLDAEHEAILLLTGDYAAVTESKIKREKESDTYIKLVALSRSSDLKIRAAAEQALADKKQKWVGDEIEDAKNYYEETRKQIDAINTLKNSYNDLMGFSYLTAVSSKQYSEGLVASEKLELELKKAINDKDEKLTSNLRERIALQNKLNAATGEEYENKIRTELLKGGIVGFSSSAVTDDNKAGAIFINDFKAVADYISNKELMNADKNANSADQINGAAGIMSAAGSAMQFAGSTMMSSANLTKEAVTGFYKYADVANSTRWAVQTSASPSKLPMAGGLGVNPLSPISLLQGRAVGGNTDPYTPYIVGEKGPELFISKHAGSIIPNNKLNSVQPSSGGAMMNFAGGVSVVLPNVSSASDYKSIAKGVLAELKIQNSRFL